MPRAASSTTPRRSDARTARSRPTRGNRPLGSARGTAPVRSARVRTTQPARRTPAVRTAPTVRALTAPRPLIRPVPVRPGTPLRSATPPVSYNKDELLRRFAPLVRHVVERVAATLPKNVDHEDLYSAGVLGLLDAHAKFDLSKGVKFETYAVWRIKGAVLDQLRALDWASRSMRRKARALDSATQRLDQKLGRAASEEELARAMKMTRGDFYRLLDQVRGAVLVSLDESRSGEDQEPSTLGDHLADPSAVNLEERLQEEEGKILLLRTLHQLPEQERLVVSLYYYEHLTLKEIGRALGISESRVSQVHTRAMSRLRLRLQNQMPAAA